MSRLSSPADEPEDDPDAGLPPGCRDPEWLGDGKDGKVYRVARADGPPAALKVIRLRNGVAEGMEVYRFVRGIEPHPNVIEYLGLWLRSADGRLLDPGDDLDPDELERMDLLLLMPLADGTLAARLPAAGEGVEAALLRLMDAAEVVGYVAQAAAGLDHLHRPIHVIAGEPGFRIVHRDVKPANLLLIDGVVKVCDFAVARPRTYGARQTLEIACTPEYAPPEVYTNEPVPQSDQYSLAVTHYQLRTGRLPFDGPAIPAHLQGRLDFGGLPAAEQAVLRRATSYQVGKRFPNCRAFADALGAAVGPTR